jgi:hypothetical protein
VAASQVCENTAADPKELTVSLNRAMGWPDDTELELVPPDPLVENFSLAEIADKAVGLIVAEQNVVKARAASAISKMAYFPVVAAVGGYTFENAIPAVPSTFGYGGRIASWNPFDFGKREHTAPAWWSCAAPARAGGLSRPSQGERRDGAEGLFAGRIKNPL